MMKTRVLMALMGMVFSAAQAFAQQKTVTGKVTSDVGAPVAGAQVVIKGTRLGTPSDASGNYSIRAEVGQVLQFRFIGNAPEERTVGASDVINVQFRRVATSLDAIVVSALGETSVKRSLGTAQQSIQGAELAQTQRENFVNSLQGRIAGVEVTSSSGVPGASTMITIRGISSISTSNQPLMIIDGLPLDNKTLNSGVFISDAVSGTSFANRSMDFTNRASDINPEDIESLVVLKGPEASALYGIDAANGAIVITTKRGKPGVGGFEYSNSFRFDKINSKPTMQRKYGPTSMSGELLGSFSYWGAPYPSGTTFYDNIDGFFQTAVTQKHNLSFSGAAPDNRINYRIAVASDKQEGVVPTSNYGRLTMTGASNAVVNRWLKADLSMTYSYSTNDQPYKGASGPLIGLMLWPQDDDASVWLTPGGLRRQITALSYSGEIDNPYFNIFRNRINGTNNRLLTNIGLVIAPFSWGNLKTNIGVDNYTNDNLISRHPESAYAYSYGGLLDLALDVTRNVNAQTLLNLNSYRITDRLSISGLVGNQISDSRSSVASQQGIAYMDPNFISINNAVNKTAMTRISRRRLLSAFGSATLNWDQYAYVTVTGRNDWTSTIPTERNSFFYPSINASLILSDAVPAIGQYMTAKLRAGYAEVGKDARPYAYKAALESRTTSYAGFGYGFWGGNAGLKPEFAVSREIGTELAFFDDRLGLDITWYRKETRDQIVENIRASYGTGFVLFNMNGASTRNEGTEITARGTPMMTKDFTWDVIANYDHSFGRVVSLPTVLPELYNSDTWLYGNVRNGTVPGASTRSLTGQFYQRNKDGKVLIDPTSGLPLRNTASFIDRGYDRQPDWTMGVTNTLRYKQFSLSFLIDIRKGGDVFNATEHFLTSRGLSNRTLDREVPRVVDGILRDGMENTATPTKNNIVIIPAVQAGFYTGMSEELFIEKDVNWVRLKDITLRYNLPGHYLMARSASVFITGTDLYLKTNYSGLDPIVNGNSAALGGSGGAGFDYGNFPIPRGFNFGLRVGF